MFEFLKHLFHVQFLLIILAVLAGIYYPQILQWIGWAQDESIAVHYESSQNQVNEKIFTAAELAKYNGDNDTPLYLALLGNVYDVTKGAKHYGPGCDYNFFVGRDASVSFISGDFENFDVEGSNDVLQLKSSDFISLDNWKRFYDKDYTYKGKVIGRFYDAAGTPTVYYHKYVAMLEQAKDAKVATEQLRVIYPDCNIEWFEEKGTRVWCTTTSGGGKQRDWVGYPRKLFMIGSDTFRCACIRPEELDNPAVMIKPYDDCEPDANECFYKVA